VLPCVAVCCIVLQRVEKWISEGSSDTECVAVCCRVLQCVAVCCSALRCGSDGSIDTVDTAYCIWITLMFLHKLIF